MEPKNDGGPYYPCEVSWNDGVLTGGIQTGNRSGASLRDHFAGLAIQAIITQNALLTIDDEVREAYRYADLMLAERERGR